MTHDQIPPAQGITPPIQIGLQLTTVEDGLRVALTIVNPTNEDVSFRTNTGLLTRLSLKTKQGEQLWNYSPGTTMDVNYWELAANTRHTDHYLIPNRDMAVDIGTEKLQGILSAYPSRLAQANEEELPEDVEGSHDYENVEDIPISVTTAPAHKHPDIREEMYEDIEPASFGIIDGDGVARTVEMGVDIEDLDIVYLEATIPMLNGVQISVTRQFDLRHDLGDLDETVLDENPTIENTTYMGDVTMVSQDHDWTVKQADTFRSDQPDEEEEEK